MPTATYVIPAGTEDDPICIDVAYTASVDCGPNDLVLWETIVAPGGAGTGSDATFSNPKGAQTTISFPAAGTYVIRASCRTPK